ncbi:MULTISPECIES: YibE/F family protein [Streptomyces]|uniref:YibE/F family protein n=1 Tax=Streptomyces morookaense TaxID=1970 RepID=A0A7Y7B148_STRMO|nr:MULTISPECIES: YibE/F family protein [Streptomyces]MCC2274969.1 YibE/F family protein [Streptomyces sp. ET3-23]NVK76736.1 YibE/F family protein [Streptomyces morookaense]GHF26805.1 membrane protein [Streptomyces morookaense]
MTPTERTHHHAPHAHSHAHSHGPAKPVSSHLRKVIAAVLVPFAAAVLAGMVILWPGSAPPHQHSGLGLDQQTESGRVVKIEEVDCAKVGAQPQQQQQSPQGGPPVTGPCEQATIEVGSGPDKGVTFTEIVQPSASRRYTVGEGVVLAYAPKAPENLRYSVTDVDRNVPMALLAGMFALAVVVIGRLRGVFALVALVISFGVLTMFILPAILQGSDPLLVAVIGGSAIMLIALYMCHGLNARTSVAVLGTLTSLLLIGLLGAGFIGWAHLTGNTDDTTGLVHGLYPHIEIQGLLLAGIIIGSLGVLDDVTVTQTSAVWELKEADPKASWRKLYASAMRIGRDHIASVVNTLVMAYAGASLPLLLLFSIADSGVGRVATSEIVAEEIVRTLVGSIGLVASVPVTTFLAALVVSADRHNTSKGSKRGSRGGAKGVSRTAKSGGRRRRAK